MAFLNVLTVVEGREKSQGVACIGLEVMKITVVSEPGECDNEGIVEVFVDDHSLTWEVRLSLSCITTQIRRFEHLMVDV